MPASSPPPSQSLLPFLLITLGTLFLPPTLLSQDSPPPSPILLSAPLTHSDWVLKDNVPGVDAGLSGVRHMLDMCRDAGWTRIYWRCLDAGRSLYPVPTAAKPGSDEGWPWPVQQEAVAESLAVHANPDRVDRSFAVSHGSVPRQGDGNA